MRLEVKESATGYRARIREAVGVPGVAMADGATKEEALSNLAAQCFDESRKHTEKAIFTRLAAIRVQRELATVS
jgi:molybdopterin converting factor small subunit